MEICFFWVVHGVNMYCTESFCSIFLVFFKNLLFYSYATHIQNFRRLRRVIMEICFFWVVHEVNMYCTMSFCSIFLVLFLNCSAIATLRVYKISKGCAKLLWRYVFFGRIWAKHVLHGEFLFDFFSSFFNLLYYSYATRIQNFKRLRRVVVEIFFFG